MMKDKVIFIINSVILWGLLVDMFFWVYGYIIVITYLFLVYLQVLRSQKRSSCKTRMNKNLCISGLTVFCSVALIDHFIVW